MAGKTRYVDLTTTAQRVSSAPGDSISGQTFHVENPPTNSASFWYTVATSSTPTFVAGAGTKTDGLTGTGGKEVRPGENVTIDLDPSEVVWAKTASGTVTVQIAEVGV